MNTLTAADYTNIFNELEKSFFKQSNLSESKLIENLSEFKKVRKQKRDDNDYFWVIVYVTFYSGFRAKTVTDKLEAIKDIFGNYEKVAKYDDLEVQKIIDSRKVIGHKQKIKGIIHNANQINVIKEEFGSFNNYLSSFGDTDNDRDLFKLIKDLRKRFRYLGEITVFHFLTDIGYNVLKPDRVLCRIFYRLGLVDSEENLFGVIAEGRKFASATRLPIRYIDIIFVAYGQVDAKPEFGLKEGICLSNNPKCELCGIYKFCKYEKKKSLTLNS